jgi:hypothetical protein
MTSARYKELMAENNVQLTEAEIDQGWHFCEDWDDLLVGPEENSEWGDNVNECLCGAVNPHKNMWLN